MDLANIARALGGRRACKAGRGWVTRCPCHEDRDPSLSISYGEKGRLLLYCFAGCDSREIREVLRERGLLEDKYVPSVTQRVVSPAYEDDDGKARKSWALDIWKRTLPVKDTPAEHYLRVRGYSGVIPPSIRYHMGLKHPAGGFYPAMVSGVAVAPDRKVVAIHRTFLMADGSGKAPVPQSKMSLGPIRGGAVRLAPAAEVLAVTEGIETGLSVMLATGIPTWAALSATGLKHLVLPPLPLAREVIIAADNDDGGVGLRAARYAAKRWLAEGRLVRIARPPEGQDFNDMLNNTF